MGTCSSADCYDGDLAAYLAELRTFSLGEVKKAAERPALLHLAVCALNRSAVPSLADAQERRIEDLEAKSGS